MEVNTERPHPDGSGMWSRLQSAVPGRGCDLLQTETVHCERGELCVRQWSRDCRCSQRMMNPWTGTPSHTRRGDAAMYLRSEDVDEMAVSNGDEGGRPRGWWGRNDPNVLNVFCSQLAARSVVWTRAGVQG